MTTYANRGKYAESKAAGYLDKVNSNHLNFDFERIPDARAAMGRMRAQVGDFAFFGHHLHGVLEVKETAHDYRLDHGKLPQLQKLKKRVLAGGRCYVVIYHSTSKVWRVVPVTHIPVITKGSWDFSDWPTDPKLDRVLTHAMLTEV